MRIIARKRRGETQASFLKRFTIRFQRSGLVLEMRRRRYRLDVPNDTSTQQSKLYRLRIKRFVARKLKDGWPIEKALDLARKYVARYKAL